jgi:hypothetical protein
VICVGTACKMTGFTEEGDSNFEVKCAVDEKMKETNYNGASIHIRIVILENRNQRVVCWETFIVF